MTRSKSSSLPRYVYRQKIKRKGKVYTYYRFRHGKLQYPLPGTPDDAAFHEAYARLIRQGGDTGRYSPGSVAHVIDLFRKSAKFRELSEATRREYTRYLNRLDRSVGERPLGTLDADYVLGVQDRLAETPVAANHMLTVIRRLVRFGRLRGFADNDPTLGVEKLKGGDGYLRWGEADIERFRTIACPIMRLAMDLGLYTGQRLSDVIRLTWNDYDGSCIRLRQKKTRTLMTIAVHHDLKTSLDAAERIGVTILTTRTGRAYHPRVFSRDFKETRERAGLDSRLSFHGLRHTAASRLAEVGCTGPEIQAITGHKSLKQVDHYIRQANQERQAETAIVKLTNGTNRG